MPSQPHDNNVEIIDLTNETTKQNTTITIDDSFAPIEIESSEGEEQNNLIDYPPDENPSPISLHLYEDDSSSSSDGESSSLPSRIPSSLSLISSPSSSIQSKTPSPKKPCGNANASPKLTKTASRELNKISRDEAKRLRLKEKEEDKLQKEANRANAANKALNNCIAKIDKNVLEVINDQEEISLRTLFDESMIRYELTDCPKIGNSITWTYKRVEVIGGACVIQLKNSSWIMVIMKGSEYLQKLLTYKSNPSDLQSIKTYVSEIRSQTKLDVILIVYDLANHLKGERVKDARNYRKTFKNRFENATNEPSTTSDAQEANTTSLAIGVKDLQDLRLMLQLEFKHEHPDWKLHIEFHEKTSEVVQILVRYTLSIARFAVKQKTRASTGLDWAINMDKEKAVDPTKSSEDLTKLWVTQLQQFSQITLPMAKAIAAEYPSPCALLDQYRNLSTSEAENLLAELYVQRTLRRQIGSNISKKIHCFMTCRDPDVHIGLS